MTNEVLKINVVEKVRKEMPNDAEISKACDVLKILSNRTRMRIVLALMKHEMCVGELCILLDMTKSAVSHQLKGLRDMDWVVTKREGKNIYYSLKDIHSTVLIKSLYALIK